MARLHSAFLIAAAMSVSAPTALTAQNAIPSAGASRPTLTIARFEGARTHGPGDPTAELADAIAVRVEESGCCRVMPREWIAQNDNNRPSLTAIRHAAVDAGVDFIITGRVTEASARSRSGAPMMPIGMGRTPLTPYGMSSRVGGPPYVPPVSTLVTVELKILESASGQAVQTIRVDRRFSSQASHPVPSPVRSRGVLGAVIGVAAMSAARQKSLADGSIATMAPEIADAILRAMPQVTRDK